MNFETHIIELIDGVMPSSPLRKSALGEVDCDVILLGDKEYLITQDDFSSEDLLLETDPFILGWNLACGAISDVVAAGGKALVYSHSMVIPSHWTEDYITELARGIAAVLQKYGVSFCGGDLGIGKSWRYTATVIGERLGRAVNRKGCRAGDAIFLTGRIGSGNLQAAMSLFSSELRSDMRRAEARISFNTHEKLAEIISSHASAAIDTSDGVFSALRTLSRLNNVGFSIHSLPYDAIALKVSQSLRLPPLLLFLGECGEYELLFTVDSQAKAALLAELSRHGIEVTEIGEITADPAQQTVVEMDTVLDLSSLSIQARDFSSPKDYLQAILHWLGTQGKTL